MLSAPLLTIRDATEDDADTIAARGLDFHIEAGWDDIAPFNTEDCRDFLRTLPTRKDAIFLIAEVDGQVAGFAAAIVAPLYFNRAHKHAQELFFWVAPEHRGRAGRRLLDTLEEAVGNIGAQSLAMVALNKVHPELTGKLYCRRGYLPSEHYWIRTL